MSTNPRTRTRFRETLLVRLTDAAATLGLSEAAIRNEIKAGRLEAKRAGRAVLVPADELRRWAGDLPPAA